MCVSSQTSIGISPDENGGVVVDLGVAPSGREALPHLRGFVSRPLSAARRLSGGLVGDDAEIPGSRGRCTLIRRYLRSAPPRTSTQCPPDIDALTIGGGCTGEVRKSSAVVEPCDLPPW